MEYLTEKQFAFRILLTDYVKTVIRENNTFSAILHRLKILASFIFFLVLSRVELYEAGIISNYLLHFIMTPP